MEAFRSTISSGQAKSETHDEVLISKAEIYLLRNIDFGGNIEMLLSISQMRLNPIYLPFCNFKSNDPIWTSAIESMKRVKSMQTAPTPLVEKMMGLSSLPSIQELKDSIKLLQTSVQTPKDSTEPTEIPVQASEALMVESRDLVQRLKLATVLQVYSNQLLKSRWIRNYSRTDASNMRYDGIRFDPNIRGCGADIIAYGSNRS